MIIYLNHSRAHEMGNQFPGQIGVIFSPERTRPNGSLPYVLDNGRFSVWSKGKEWNERLFWKMIETRTTSPEWIVVPDVVGDARATFDEWNAWEPRLRQLGWTLALAVQDGMLPQTVKKYTNADVIFVGGTRYWKRHTLPQWCNSFDRVHVGRVNYERWLWDAHQHGAESTDGTGWFRGDKKQLDGLLRYLERTKHGMGPSQAMFEFAMTFNRTGEQGGG